jgi:hypothetical protein
MMRAFLEIDKSFKWSGFFGGWSSLSGEFFKKMTMKFLSLSSMPLHSKFMSFPEKFENEFDVYQYNKCITLKVVLFVIPPKKHELFHQLH